LDVCRTEQFPTGQRGIRQPAEAARQLIQSGIIPRDDAWSGWLGRYQKALEDAAMTLELKPLAKETDRKKKRDFGRSRQTRSLYSERRMLGGRKATSGDSRFFFARQNGSGS